MDDREMRRRVEEARVGRLATLRPGGAPHLVPVTFALDRGAGGAGDADAVGDDNAGERIVTAVDQKPKSTTDLQRLRNIVANPQVCLLVDHYDDDWSRLWWVRVDGRARVVEDGRERDRAVRLLAGKYGQYQDDPPEGPAIVITPTGWAGWSASDGSAHD